MNYQVLARKWRPHRFEDMVGQEHVLRALINALDNNRLHHAYLFTGTRGVGKTTIARIFAKSLNCEKGVSANPCGECAACRDIDEGRFFDLIEVDAASRTKVDQTRELLENVPYAPASGRYKVYLIDEVHMFSDHSFNALLKTLEEPPEHVKFLLATTDPQKVPVTVLSRCLQFSLKRLPELQISEYLADIMAREEIEAEKSALAHIARAADGSMRDALSLLDQAIAYSQGSITAAGVESMLGRPSPDRVLDLLEALGAGDAQKTMALVSVFADYSPDFSGLLADLLSVLHQIALLQGVPGAQNPVSFDPHRLHELAVRIAPEDVHLFYQTGLIGRRDIALAPDMREGFEMTLLRMLAFRPVNGETAAGEYHAPAKTIAAQAAPARMPQTSDSAQPQTIAEPPQVVEPVVEEPAAPLKSPSDHMAALKASLNDDKSRPKAQKKTPEKPAEVVSEPPRVAPTPQAAPASPASKPDWSNEDWPQMLGSMDLQGMPLELANNCVLSAIGEDAVELGLQKEYESLLQPGTVRQLEQALAGLLGKPVKLQMQIREGELETPARIRQRQADSRLQAARQSIETDPIVQKICGQLEGVVQLESIRPIGE
ncbi:MAG: DNA polymerase III subunit gamma/tau [Gammaproteobacteria bacterium]|nr:DNA polymerase III subunit gamma/tau [Gammaproteobacteria bacterium]